MFSRVDLMNRFDVGHVQDVNMDVGVWSRLHDFIFRLFSARWIPANEMNLTSAFSYL